MKNKSVSQHAFSLVPNVKKPRSVFNRSHTYKSTFDCDYLYPFYAYSVSPGDTINLKHSVFIRLLSPVYRPLMDNLHFDWFYFFVPYRLVWTNFVKFMGEQNSPGDSISYVIPRCTSPDVAGGGIPVGHLYDYLGLPTGPLNGGGSTSGIGFNNLVGRSYNRIWHEWFKDENLQNAVTLDMGDGPDTFSNYNLLKRGKRHDYFTSALPWQQKGTAVSFSLGTTAPVIGNDVVPQFDAFDGTFTNRQIQSNALTNAVHIDGASPGAVKNLVFDDTVTGLVADLSAATSATINSLRQSIALQQFLENDARGGTRYTEIVRQRWGVIKPDQSWRSELLSLGSSPVKITPVAQTVDNTVATPYGLGALGGFGTSGSVGQGFVKSFNEHGTVLMLAMVRADLTYSQGIGREWNYLTRYDLINPEFCHLGEQAILNREIYANVPDGVASGQREAVFGYQERYAEGRYSPSLITGLLRPAATGTLDVWHLSEEFSSLPTLGSTFIQSSANGPLDRAITVPSEPQFIIDIYFQEKWARVMPMFGVPGLLKL